MEIGAGDGTRTRDLLITNPPPPSDFAQGKSRTPPSRPCPWHSKSRHDGVPVGTARGVVTDTYLRHSWEIRIDWTADATVFHDVRTRLGAFLAPVCATIADLAATLTYAT